MILIANLQRRRKLLLFKESNRS